MTDTERGILLAEASSVLADELMAMLDRAGYPCAVARTAEAVMARCRSAAMPPLLILDLSLPQPADGLAVMQALKQEGRLPPTIVMTGNASVNTAVRAMQLGARDFLIKPFQPARFFEAVALILSGTAKYDSGKGETMPASLAGEAPDDQDDGPMVARPPLTSGVYVPAYKGFIGTSPAMLAVYDQIEQAAKSQATVFITGESGTGKEVCAEAVHALGVRAAKAFIPINCAAIPRDLMESELFGHVKGAFTGAIADREGAASLAAGGSLFLDEIAEMAPEMQTKLLRFLQDSTFMKVGGSRLERANVRIICATNRDPLTEIRAGRFREDLFYRLHVLPIAMPPLRSRGDDITDLATGLLNRYALEEGKSFDGFTEEAEDMLRRYAWPGNIRQLQNVVRHIAVMHPGGTVKAAMLPAALLHQSAATARDAPENIHPFESQPFDSGRMTGAKRPVIRPLADVEREVIEQAIALYGGNIARAASALQISPSTIYRKKMGWDSSPITDGAASDPASRPVWTNY